MGSYLDRSMRASDTCRCDPNIAERNPMCPLHGRTANYHERPHQCRCGKRLPIEAWKRFYVGSIPFCSDECADQHKKSTGRG